MPEFQVCVQGGQNRLPGKILDLECIMQDYINLIISEEGKVTKKAILNDEEIASAITKNTGITVSSRAIRRFRSKNAIEPCGQGWGGRRRGVDPAWLQDEIQDYIDVTTTLTGKVIEKAIMSDNEMAEAITASTGIEVTASAILRYRLNNGIQPCGIGWGGEREGAGRPQNEDGPRKPIRKAKVTISDYELVQVARDAYRHTPPQGHYEIAAVVDGQANQKYIDRWVWTRKERFTPKVRQAGLRTYTVQPSTPPGYSQAQAWDAVRGGGK